MAGIARLSGRAAVILLGGLLPLATTTITTNTTMASWLLVAALGLGLGLIPPAAATLPRPVFIGLVAGLAVFLLACGLSATWWLSLVGRYPRYEGFPVVACYAIALWVGARLLGRNSPYRTWFASALSVAALVNAGVSLVQLAVDPSSRVVGLLGNSSTLGAWAVICLVWLGWRAMSSPRPLELAGIAGAAVCLLLAASRAAWIAAVIASLATVGVRRLSAARPLLWPPLVAAAGLICAILLVPSTQSRVTGDTPFAAATASGRLLLWQDSGALVAANPWLGTGPSRFVDAIGAFHTEAWAAAVGPYAPPDSPHFLPLQILAATGVIGLVAMLGLGGCCLASLPRRGWSATTGAGVLAFGAAIIAWTFGFTDPVTTTTALAIFGAALGIAVERPGVERWVRAPAALAVAAAVWISSASLVSEARLAAAISNPSVPGLVAVATAAPADPDLTIRVGRVLNSYAEATGDGAAAAASLLKPVCDQLPESTECRLALGDALSLAGQNREATEVLRTGLAIDPTNVDLYLKLGIAEAELGEFEAAQTAFQQAAQLRPAAAEPWQNLAVLYDREGMIAQAEAARAEAEARS